MSANTSQASPRFASTRGNGRDVGFEGAIELLRAWRDSRTPDPVLGVSAWADAHRLLSPRGANEAGRWRTSRTPYLRDIMDALSPMHPAQRVVVMKGAQIGATEAGNTYRAEFRACPCPAPRAARLSFTADDCRRHRTETCARGDSPKSQPSPQRRQHRKPPPLRRQHGSR